MFATVQKGASNSDIVTGYVNGFITIGSIARGPCRGMNRPSLGEVVVFWFYRGDGGTWIHPVECARMYCRRDDLW